MKIIRQAFSFFWYHNVYVNNKLVMPEVDLSTGIFDYAKPIQKLLNKEVAVHITSKKSIFISALYIDCKKHKLPILIDQSRVSA